jgi:hypothetical protein
LRRFFELQADYRDTVSDLKDVGAVDREVMRFFMRCETDGVTLEKLHTIYSRMDGTRKGLIEWQRRGSDAHVIQPDRKTNESIQINVIDGVMKLVLGSAVISAFCLVPP